MMRFAEWIERDQAFGVTNGGGEIAPVLARQRQPLQHTGEALAILRTQRRDPVIVESAQQVVAVEGGGLVERAAFHRGVELPRVHRTGRIAAPLDGLVIAL